MTDIKNSKGAILQMETRKKFNIGDRVVGFLALQQPNARRRLLPAITGEITYINEEHRWLSITNEYFTEGFWMECVAPASKETLGGAK